MYCVYGNSGWYIYGGAFIGSSTVVGFLEKIKNNNYDDV